MSLYLKESMVVEAVQYDGTFTLAFLRENERVGAGDQPGTVAIHTPDGIMTARRGEWIIRGADRGLSVCTPADFVLIYKPIAQGIAGTRPGEEG